MRTDVVGLSRRQRFGNVEKKDSDDCVSARISFEVNGVRDRGRGRKTWVECVKKTCLNLVCIENGL